MNDLAKKLLKDLVKDDSEIDFRIRQGIEQNRKGFGEIRLVDRDGKPVTQADVQLKLLRHEFHFGCNLFMLDQFPDAEQNARYRDVFKNIFNLAVVPFYWSDLEPEDGAVRFEKNSRPIYRRPPPDLALEYCRENGVTPKGHPLLWHQFWPAWMPTDKQEIARRLERRFREIAQCYRDSITIWDACNEAQTWHPQARPLPDRHVDLAFELAERYFGNDTFIYNDDNQWWHYSGDYSPVYLLVRGLLDRGRKVGGLGLQYHMFEGLLNQADQFMNPRHVLACLDQYHKLGVPVNFSEVSIISRRDLGDGDGFQALAVEKLYRLWFSHPATNGIIWWNMVDGTAAYAPLGSEEGENSLRAGLMNYDFSPKPAYSALEHLIKKEWHTDVALKYQQGAQNRFHGFYGDYEATIKTSHGTSKKQIKLSNKNLNVFKITV